MASGVFHGRDINPRIGGKEERMKGIDARLKDFRLQHWSKCKASLILYRAKGDYNAGAMSDIKPADGNTIIEQIAENAFNEGFNGGTAKLFSILSRARDEEISL